MARYRVRRDLEGNHYTQLKAATLPDCKALLRSIKGRWDELATVPVGLGEEPFRTKLKPGKELVVTQGERIVDRYIVERV